MKLPSYLMIEPTNICNLDCITCFRTEMIENGNLTVGIMDIGRIEEIGNKLRDIDHIRFHGTGELFLLANHVEIIEKIRSIYPNAWIELVTNGQYASTDENRVSNAVNKLTFSISGSTKETYEQFHKYGSWNQLLENVKRFSKIENTLSLEINFVCYSGNHNELKDMVKLSKILNVDVLRVNLYQDWLDGISRNLLNTDIIDSIRDAQDFAIKSDVKIVIVGDSEFDPSKCEWMEKRALISYNGDILPCCMRPDHKLSIGNIFRDDISEIWNGNTINDLRSKRENGKLGFCNSCPYVKNKEFLKLL